MNPVQVHSALTTVKYVSQKQTVHSVLMDIFWKQTKVSQSAVNVQQIVLIVQVHRIAHCVNLPLMYRMERVQIMDYQIV